MRPKPIYVIDIVRDIVEATELAVIQELHAYDTFIEEVNFVPGTPLEIEEVLTLMAKNTSLAYKRYPLFALIMSFPEDKGRQVGVDGVEDIILLIARRSNNTDKTPARYENNFKPILYPIYLEFLNQLYLSPKIITETPDNIPHEKIDYPYYNADKQENAFGDYVDAIQIKIKLKLLLKNCY